MSSKSLYKQGQQPQSEIVAHKTSVSLAKKETNSKLSHKSISLPEILISSFQ